MENDLRYALRYQDCSCPKLREGAWYFRVDLRDASTVTSPVSVGPQVESFLANLVSLHQDSNPELRQSLITVPEGTVLGPASLILYRMTGWSDEERILAYGLVAEATAMEELFDNWYYQDPVLPGSLAADRSNDSLLEMAVLGVEGTEVFRSHVAFGNPFPAVDTLGPDLGFLIVRAGIKPDAAGELIIGGLPRSRLPLLLVLLALTLGVGVAALFQIRREHRLGHLRNDFISSVSHEFRTPLTQIRLFAEILASGKLTSEEERRRSTRVINREAGRLTHLVENILQFSEFRMTSPRAGEVEPIELGPMLAEVTDAFFPQAQSRGIRIDVEVAEDVWVMGRRGGVHRILSNLLDNALKYGPDGQTVRIEEREGSEEIVRLSVEDEGPGIPQRDRKGIWDPYRRLDRDLEGKVQGSGIGLSVVAELAQVFGAATRVENGRKGGARFIVEFRRAQPAERHSRKTGEEH